MNEYQMSEVTETINRTVERAIAEHIETINRTVADAVRAEVQRINVETSTERQRIAESLNQAQTNLTSGIQNAVVENTRRSIEAVNRVRDEVATYVASATAEAVKEKSEAAHQMEKATEAADKADKARAMLELRSHTEERAVALAEVLKEEERVAAKTAEVRRRRLEIEAAVQADYVEKGLTRFYPEFSKALEDAVNKSLDEFDSTGDTPENA